MARGRFITLEGGEGVGKTTQARLLAEALSREGVRVVSTREPGGAPGSEVLRELLLSGATDWSPLAETLLHFAARAEHVAKTIRPALESGAWVVCDRFADSTMVYQGWGQGADRTAIAALTGMLGVIPDLTIILDAPLETSMARLRARDLPSDRYERLGEAFFARLRDGFRALARIDAGRCVLVSADAPVETVAAEVLAVVRRRLRLPA